VRVRERRKREGEKEDVRWLSKSQRKDRVSLVESTIIKEDEKKKRRKKELIK
jgi:hypothetical protein